MSDIDKLRELFTSFGLEVPESEIDAQRGEEDITFHADSQPKVGGYSYFIGRFTFNLDGSFKSMSFWE